MAEIPKGLSTTVAKIALVLGLTACGPNGIRGEGGDDEVGNASESGTEAGDGSDTNGSATDTTTEAGDGSATDTTDGGEPFTQTEITRFAIGESLANCEMAVDEQGVLVEGEFECEPNTTITLNVKGVAGTEDQEAFDEDFCKVQGPDNNLGVLSQPQMILGEDGTFFNEPGSGVILYNGQEQTFTAICADGEPAENEKATLHISPK